METTATEEEKHYSSVLGGSFLVGLGAVFIGIVLAHSLDSLAKIIIELRLIAWPLCLIMIFAMVRMFLLACRQEKYFKMFFATMFIALLFFGIVSSSREAVKNIPEVTASLGLNLLGVKG